MKILSLFDGISCGRVALQKANINVEKYFASEIKDIAIKCSKDNWNDITHIGDVTKVTKEMVGEIDLLIGGSPCQNFSLIGNGKGLEGEESKLFFEYLRILKEVQPKYFILENVKMSKVNKAKLDEMLGVVGIEINSSLVSFQNRPRIYWTNIPNVVQPKDLNINFQDFIGSGDLDQAKVNKTPSRERMWNEGKGYFGLGTCDNITNKNKCRCLTRRQDRSPNSGLIEYNGFCRFLTRDEMELAQTLPLGYTKSLSYIQAQDVLGDGWTVDVIAHILSFINKENEERK